jgi:sugar/nucleoside kinase (ribokinase family)
MAETTVHLGGDVVRGGEVVVQIASQSGGSAANIAADLVQHGLPARFIGHVGDDLTGASLVDDFERSGGETALVRRGRTASVITLVDPDGERSFLTDYGDGNNVKPSDVAESWLDDAALCVLVSYSLFSDAYDAAAALMELANNRGIPIALDASSALELVGFGVMRYRRLLALYKPQVVFLNEREARALELDADDPESWFDGPAVTVIHQGPNPAIALVPGKAPIVAPAARVARVIDTTGAGDAFAAGFIGAWLSGATARTALEAGHRLAAQVVQVAGARITKDGIPDNDMPTLPFEAADRLRLALG